MKVEILYCKIVYSYSFSKHLLKIYCVSGTILGMRIWLRDKTQYLRKPTLTTYHAGGATTGKEEDKNICFLFIDFRI